MTGVDTRIEAFFAQAPAWQAELGALRRILLSCGLAEEYKWRGPCYTHAGGNVATLWGFKDSCILSFFKGVLLQDPAGVLVAPGENSRSVRMMRFGSTAEIAARHDLIQTYVRDAMAQEVAGNKVAFPKDDLVFPDEILQEFDRDPVFKTAFLALTPGRQRGYLLHVAQAKQTATRSARIAKWRAHILAGKGMNDR